MSGPEYRLMKPGEEEAVAALAARVFNESVAPGYSEDGVQEFLRYATPEGVKERSEAGHFVLVAVEDDDITGLIEMRHSEHVAMLFVAQPGRGIGKELMHRAMARCRVDKPDVARVTVHAAPGAVPMYERMGFAAAGEERVVNGIRFVPMVLEVGEASSDSV